VPTRVGTANDWLSVSAGVCHSAGLRGTVQAGLWPNVRHHGTAAVANQTFVVLSDAAWTARADAPWISVTSGATGAGDGQVAYAVSAAPSRRAGTITVSWGGPRALFAVAQQGTAAGTDTDGDGAPDDWELLKGFDPADPSDGDEDPDGDGLPNCLECCYDADPFDPDTDGDGLLDGEETLLGTDPRDADTDNDGFFDDREILSGTDPLSLCSTPPHDETTHLRVDVTIKDRNLDDDGWDVFVEYDDEGQRRLFASNVDNVTALTTSPLMVPLGTVAKFTIRRIEVGQWQGSDEYDISVTPDSDAWVEAPQNPPLAAYVYYDEYGNPPDVSGLEWSYAAPRVELEGHEAWRATTAGAVPEDEEEEPGFLVTANVDGGALGDPLEAKLVFRGLPDGFGLTRHIEFDPPSRTELRFADESVGPVVPTGAVHLNSVVPVDEDFTRDAAMYLPDTWGDAVNCVTVTYVVKDSAGTVVGTDAVRLLRPVVIPIGDSLTYGLMREQSPSNKFRTPRWDCQWTAYPGTAEWSAPAMQAPWTNANNRTTLPFQGYRGYLRESFSGFDWRGEDTLGHGPSHMGYPGGTIEQIRSRWLAPALSTDGCYAVVVYFAGMNDIIGNADADTVFGRWTDGVADVASLRAGKGKTLLVAVQLPQMATHYSGYTVARATNLTAMNTRIASYDSPFPHLSKTTAQTRGVAHDIEGNVKDDGLHFFAEGYGGIESKIRAAVVNGVQGLDLREVP
jgi:hypothetical protein